MPTNKITGIMVAALIMAILVPVALGQFANSAFGSTSENFTALQPDSITEDLQLTFFPILDETSDPVRATTTVDNGTVTVDEVANYLATNGFTAVNLTGVIHLASTTKDIGDVLTVGYTYDRNFGDAEPLWDAIPIFVVLGLALGILAWLGVTKRRKEN